MANSTKRKVDPVGNGHDNAKRVKTFNGLKPYQSPQQKIKSSSGKSFAERTKKPPQTKGNDEKDSVTPAPQKAVESRDNPDKSRESHQKQKELIAQRKALKPHADDIARAKKLWEQLRRKSHVEKEEREKLVTELFGIIEGRVKDFVFKHDSVRVIQCAVKYANRTQKLQIASELSGSIRDLAESKYAKFLLAKLIVEGDDETRKKIIPEFYGHVRKLLNHPEASWILDDVYRTVASKEQKARILRELYGPEFAVFQSANGKATADLSRILTESPEKRQVIMQYLHERINQLVQKKMTGFTILHDAMLQYLLNVPRESEAFGDFLRLIIGDKDEEETDLLKNLAFTASGSELVCRTFAHSPAKDRRRILKSYTEAVEMLALDKWGQRFLLTVFALMDDTRETSQRIFSELILLKKAAAETASDEQTEKIFNLATNQTGHVALLYPFLGTERKILPPPQFDFMQQIQELGKTMSKKDPVVRRNELNLAISQPCIDTVTKYAKELIANSFGCLFISQVMLYGQGKKEAALEAIAALAAPDATEAYDEQLALFNTPFAGKMLKALIASGQFDKSQDKFVAVAELDPFRSLFLDAIKPNVKEWVNGDGGFVILNLLRADWQDKTQLDLLKKAVKSSKKQLEQITKAPSGKADADTKRKAMGAGLLLKEIST